MFPLLPDSIKLGEPGGSHQAFAPGFFTPLIEISRVYGQVSSRLLDGVIVRQSLGLLVGATHFANRTSLIIDWICVVEGRGLILKFGYFSPGLLIILLKPAGYLHNRLLLAPAGHQGLSVRETQPIFLNPLVKFRRQCVFAVGKHGLKHAPALLSPEIKRIQSLSF